MTNGWTEEERLCRSQLQSNAISAKWENSIADLGVFFSGLALQIDCIVCYCPNLRKRSKEYKSQILRFFRFCYTAKVVCYCPILPQCNSRCFTMFPNVSLQKDSNCIIIGTLRYYKYKWLLFGMWRFKNKKYSVIDNVSSHCQQQQSYSGLRPRGRSNSTYF